MDLIPWRLWLQPSEAISCANFGGKNISLNRIVRHLINDPYSQRIIYFY